MTTSSGSLRDLHLRPMRHEDVPAAQELGVAAWSDIASRELGRKVRYPMRPRRIIEAYLWKEPEGCLVAEDEGRIVGAAYSHAWGDVGWFGPFEVLPEMQDKGVGRTLLSGCESFLERKGCRVFGLETMSNSTKNLHFYMRGGYNVIGSSLIMEKCLRSDAEAASRLEESSLTDVTSSLTSISSLSRKGHPFCEYSKEVEMASRFGLGAVFLERDRSKLKGMAVLHSYYPPEESDHASMRLLLVDPKARGQRDSFSCLLASCEAWAFRHGRKRLFVRFQAEKLPLYEELITHGYKLSAANLRLARGSRFLEQGRYHLAAWAG